MTEIVEAIDNWTQDRYGVYTTNLHGFVELVKKTAGDGKEQIFPTSVTNRKQISIDDKYNFITWIRWAQPAIYEASEEWSFGKDEARFATLPLRLVLIHKTVLGEDICFDFINAFPNKFSVSGYKLVFAKPDLSIDPDHEAIVQAELGPDNYLAYEKHRLTWNVYVININVQFLECEELTP